MGLKIWTAEIFINNLSPGARHRLLNYQNEERKVFGNKRKGFDELFLVQTDSQFLVYGVGESADPMLNFFLQDPEIYEHVHFYKSTQASVNHLFATASGLCSDIKGSARVAEDIALALHKGLQAGGVGLVLDNMVRQSLRVSRKVRSATGMEGLTEVVVNAGLDMMVNECQSPLDMGYLVVGSGDVARISLDYFQREGIRNVIICSEDESQACELAGQYGVKSVDFELLDTYLQFSDVIVTEYPVREIVTVPLQTERSQRRIFVDFTNGSSGNEALQMNPLVKVFTIDDINNNPSTNANVYHSLEEAWKMVETEACLAISQMEPLRHAPWLSWCWSSIVGKGEQEISLLKKARFPASNLDRIKSFNKALMRQKGVVPVQASVVTDKQGTAVNAWLINNLPMDPFVRDYSAHYN